jgi:type II secretory pathway pseudopilin PulG
MRRVKGQAGMSLVEATIILLVLMLLTSVLAPSIFDYFRDAQTVKVKEDCEAIGITVARLVRDVGPCLRKVAGPGFVPCDINNRVDLLYSDGPPNYLFVPANVTTPAFNNAFVNTVNWNTDNPANPNADSMVNQFTTNAPMYAVPGAPEMQHTYPSMGLGWRGAYLPSPIGPDPWGRRYLVNSAFLAPAQVLSPPIPLDPDGGVGWNRDVFCISAGPNQLYETDIAGRPAGTGVPTGGTFRGGDDFIFVIQGSTR